MTAVTDRTVLLFYKEFESDRFFRGDRYVKRVVRPVYNLVRRDQVVSGFYVWYSNLVTALRRQGYTVIVNRFGLAKRNAGYPVGIVGYPDILTEWTLPNPAVLGPGMYDHPGICPDLMTDRRFQLYIVTCKWMQDVFEPVYGPRCVQWYAGIDTDIWRDTRHFPKSVDFLIYDKIRWNRESYEESLLQPIVKALDKSGSSYHVLRYRHYRHEAYRDLLKRSKAMIFLCEHETQGLAYQEALASNVPILAWDNGFWLDPRRPQFDPNPVPATSVPYFSAECGERFRDIDEFFEAFDRFRTNLAKYEPRRYVEQALSLRGSAELYIRYYKSLIR